MDQALIQRTRYLLRARFRRPQTCPDSMFISACKQSINWIESHPILKYAALALKDVPGEYQSQIDAIAREAPITCPYNPGRYAIEQSIQHSSACYLIIKKITDLGDLDDDKVDFLLRCFGEFLTGEDDIKSEDAIKTLRDVLIDGLYEYLDEHLDERNAIYGILLKYKQRSEWFQKTSLREIAEAGLEGKTGERALVLDVQQYVFDQGVEFYIEPSSPSGEADLILKTADERYLVIDAKYLKADATQSVIREKIAGGFHQVYRYCMDFNTSEGFLVVFMANSIRMRLDLETADGFPYLKLGNKLIYYIEINISDEPSASKSGKPTEMLIEREHLLSSDKVTAASAKGEKE